MTKTKRPLGLITSWTPLVIPDWDKPFTFRHRYLVPSRRSFYVTLRHATQSPGLIVKYYSIFRSVNRPYEQFVTAEETSPTFLFYVEFH